MIITKFFNSDVPVDALGRNGTMKCIGVNVSSWGTKDAISIQPINSKQRIGRCWINLPLEFVDKFIEQIKRVEHNTLKEKWEKSKKLNNYESN